MEELRYKKLDELKPEGKLIATAAFKPITAPIVMGIVGIALLFVNEFLIRLLGAFFVAIAAFVMIYVKDKKTIDIYEKGCIIFNSSNSELAYWLSFEDVEEWDVLHESGHDTVEFTLLDKNKAIVDTFQSNKVFNALQKVIPEKSHIAVLEKKNKELNVSPVDALKNLLNRK